MDTSFTIDQYSSLSTYSKHSIVYELSGSERIYYYSLVDNNLNNTPSSSPSYWTTSFYWTPNYSTTADINQRKVEMSFGDGYTQRMRDGINTNPLNFNLVFDNRSDAEAAAILHFIEQKGGVDNFVYNSPTIFNKTGLKYVAVDPKWSSSSYNLNNVTVTLKRDYNP